MSKIRFFKVRFEAINRSWDEIVPAHSGVSAVSYFNIPNVNVVAEFLGFHEVDISCIGAEIYFHALGVTYGRHDEQQVDGYKYLYNQLQGSINKVINLLREQGRYPYPDPYPYS